ncbi:MAG: transposase [Armatimonadetes bacterium]|nr:transposase [Armatimonadota bacterium]
MRLSGNASTPCCPCPTSQKGVARTYTRRAIFNAIFYQLRTGCPWRRLPHDFPPQGAVWFHLRRWRDGTNPCRLA